MFADSVVGRLLCSSACLFEWIEVFHGAVVVVQVIGAVRLDHQPPVGDRLVGDRLAPALAEVAEQFVLRRRRQVPVKRVADLGRRCRRAIRRRRPSGRCDAGGCVAATSFSAKACSDVSDSSDPHPAVRPARATIATKATTRRRTRWVGSVGDMWPPAGRVSSGAEAHITMGCQSIIRQIGRFTLSPRPGRAISSPRSVRIRDGVTSSARPPSSARVTASGWRG